MGMFQLRSGSLNSGAARHAASEAGHAAREAATSVLMLEKEVDRLALICEGLWTLLKQRMALTDEELMAQIASLDLADGKADGRKELGPLACRQCGRTNSRRHDFCIYCGTLLRTRPFE